MLTTLSTAATCFTSPGKLSYYCEELIVNHFDCYFEKWCSVCFWEFIDVFIRLPSVLNIATSS